MQVNMHGSGHTISKHGLDQKEHLFPSPSELKARGEVKNKCLYLMRAADSSDTAAGLVTNNGWQLQWEQRH